MNAVPAVPPPPLRILVVENNPDTLKYLQMYLEQLGHHVTSARTLEAGITTAQAEAPEVIISDIGLPDGMGWDLLQRAQLDPPAFGIAMSGYGMNADRARTEAAGYRHHLLKPFTPDHLDPLLGEAAQERAAGPRKSEETPRP